MFPLDMGIDIGYMYSLEPSSIAYFEFVADFYWFSRKILVKLSHFSVK